jgi:hypothetical protein
MLRISPPPEGIMQMSWSPPLWHSKTIWRPSGDQLAAIAVRDADLETTRLSRNKCDPFSVGTVLWLKVQCAGRDDAFLVVGVLEIKTPDLRLQRVGLESEAVALPGDRPMGADRPQGPYRLRRPQSIPLDSPKHPCFLAAGAIQEFPPAAGPHGVPRSVGLRGELPGFAVRLVILCQRQQVNVWNLCLRDAQEGKRAAIGRDRRAAVGRGFGRGAGQKPGLGRIYRDQGQ